MNRPSTIDSKRIEEECESPHLRGPLFAGIVVFSAFPYRELSPADWGDAYDPLWFGDHTYVVQGRLT